MEIKNLLFQPISLHLAVDGEGLHLNAREVREVLADRVSAEIRRAVDRGLVSLIGRVGIVPHTTSDDVPVSVAIAPTDDQQTTQKKGSRR